RRVLVSNRPSWSLSREAQLALPRRPVNLDDDPINFVRQRFALGLPALNKFPDLLQLLRQLSIRIHLEPRQLQRIHRFRLAIEISLPVFQQHVCEEVHAALRGNRGLELPPRPRRKIAGIRKGRESLTLALFIQLPESRKR